MSTATEVRERPILFSAPMVRALLAGTKTQTRRVIKPQPKADWLGYMRVDGGALQNGPDYPDGDNDFVPCPYGDVGDRLWVKTAYTTRYDPERNETCWSIPRLHFITTHGEPFSSTTGKRKRDGNHPPMFMPNWLSQELRLPLLEITDVRVQRLNEISPDDAIAEGVPTEPFEGTVNGEPATIYPFDPRYMFTALWHTIHKADGPHGWDANPFVWVIAFRRIVQ